MDKQSKRQQPPAWNDPQTLQSQYTPLEAFMIAMGHSGAGLLGQGEQAYYRMRGNLSDAVGAQSDVQAWRDKERGAYQQRAEDAQLYAPMTHAFPTLTAMGEALPRGMWGGVPGLVGAAQIVNADRVFRDMGRTHDVNRLNGPIADLMAQQDSPQDVLRRHFGPAGGK